MPANLSADKVKFRHLQIEIVATVCGLEVVGISLKMRDVIELAHLCLLPKVEGATSRICPACPATSKHAVCRKDLDVMME